LIINIRNLSRCLAPFIFMLRGDRPGQEGFLRDTESEDGRSVQWILVDTKIVENSICDLKNVTITMDEEVARWARIRAAELETSVSRMVGKMLKEKMLVDQSYEKARDRYLAQPPQALKKAKEKYPARQDLYERR
jgi:hypothetical protein